MNMKHAKRALARALLLSAALLAGQGTAWAGVFSVTPVRIYMSAHDRAVAVTLSNDGDNPIVLQADIYTWTQKPDGTDDMALTEDLLLSPPIIKLAPKARQVVRLAMLAPRDPTRQMTYRMILREVPEAAQPKDKVEVPIALALNMPIFVTPPAAKRDVKCDISRGEAQALQAVCANTGTAYAQIRELSLKRDGQELGSFQGGAYVLPGARKTFKLKTAQQTGSGEAVLSVTFDDFQSQTAVVSLP